MIRVIPNNHSFLLVQTLSYRSFRIKSNISVNLTNNCKSGSQLLHKYMNLLCALVALKSKNFKSVFVFLKFSGNSKIQNGRLGIFTDTRYNRIELFKHLASGKPNVNEYQKGAYSADSLNRKTSEQRNDRIYRSNNKMCYMKAFLKVLDLYNGSFRAYHTFDPVNEKKTNKKKKKNHRSNGSCFKAFILRLVSASLII